MTHNFIDLCAGIGGFRQAFDSYGKCLVTCEIDKFAKNNYLANYYDGIWENDIKKIIPESLPNFDILCAGFPCQAFSLAGKQQGFADTRGTIFFDIAQIINTKKPKVFVMENVKNLLSHDKGNTFKTIQKSLDDLNYYHHYFTLNAQYFVPQRRERIYIIGANKELFTEIEFKILIASIEASYELQKQKPLPKIKDILETNVDAKYTLSDKLWSFLQAHSKKHAAKGNGFGFGLIDPNKDITTRTLTARYYKDGSEILIKQEGKNPRKLTPRECARLMGFPETFNIAVSNTQAYKQFGNSVVVSIVQMISKEINDFLNKKQHF